MTLFLGKDAQRTCIQLITHNVRHAETTFSPSTLPLKGQEPRLGSHSRFNVIDEMLEFFLRLHNKLDK